MCGRRPELVDSLATRGIGIFAFNFIYSSDILALVGTLKGLMTLHEVSVSVNGLRTPQEVSVSESK